MSNPRHNPDEHGEEITGLSAEQRQAEIDALNHLHADLEGSAAAKLATQLEPIIPDGGALGRALTRRDRLTRAARARDSVRLWSPAVLASIAAAVVLLAFELPGPLAVYAVALAAYAWWMCAGRPGPVEAVRMGCYRLADAWSWIRRRITRLAVRRAAYETRRTAADTK